MSAPVSQGRDRAVTRLPRGTQEPGRQARGTYDRRVARLVDTLLHPQRTPPPPIDVDLARVMVAGTALWVVALVVALLRWADVVAAEWGWVCAAGVLLGVVGLLWARRNGRMVLDGTGAMRGRDED